MPSCHPDELVVRRWMGFDQFGLWTAIIGCYVPGLRLALWCFPEVNWLYSCTVIFTGVSGMILLRVQIKDKIKMYLEKSGIQYLNPKKASGASITWL